MSPDDRCGVCNEIRENHGDKNHEFNVDGNLVPRKGTPTVPKATPPNMGNDPAIRVQLRTVERLIQKGVLNGEDLLYIFGGGDNVLPPRVDSGTAQEDSAQPGTQRSSGFASPQ